MKEFKVIWLFSNKACQRAFQAIQPYSKNTFFEKDVKIKF